MRVQITPHKDKQGFFTVTPHGSIDTDTHEDFRNHVKDILTPSARGILIDLKNVDYISSAGLGVLFFAKKFLTENGGELVFCHPKPQIQKLFDTVQFLPKESVFKSLEEADQYFYKIMNEEIQRQKKKTNQRL